MISVTQPLSSLSQKNQDILIRLNQEIVSGGNALPCKAKDTNSNLKALIFKGNENENRILLYKGKEGRSSVIKSKYKTGHVRQLYNPDNNTITQVMKLVLRAAPNTDEEKDIIEEAQLIQELQSNPFIVRQFGFVLYDGSHNGSPYTKVVMVQELYDKNLNQHIQDLQEFRKPSFRVNFWMYESLLYGLQKLHQEGIVHNDIKEGNILIKPQEKVIAYCDLAFAFKESELDDGKKMKYMSRGTPNYLAPEKAFYLFFKASDSLLKEFSSKSDVFSLGLVFHQLFHDETHLYKIVTGNLFAAHKELVKHEQPSESCKKTKKLCEEKFSQSVINMEEAYKDFRMQKNMKSLIYGMLYPDPSKRYSAKEAYDSLMELKP